MDIGFMKRAFSSSNYLFILCIDWSVFDRLKMALTLQITAMTNTFQSQTLHGTLYAVVEKKDQRVIKPLCK